MLKLENFEINYNIIKNNNFTNLKEFYNDYGYSEEYIIYPILKSNNKKLALYSHFNNKNILNNYCLEGIKTLQLLNYDVILLTNCKNFINIDTLSFYSIYYENPPIDFYMIQKFFNTNFNNILKYDELLLLNDSVLFPIQGIKHMSNVIDKYSQYDLWGLYSSPEFKYHIQTCYINFKNKMFNDLNLFLNKYKIECKKDAINIEINLTEYFLNKNYNHNVVIKYDKYINVDTINLKCLLHNPKIFPLWINDENNIAIKWKYINNFLKLNDYNLPYLNYLMRYLNFDTKCEIMGEPEK